MSNVEFGGPKLFPVIHATNHDTCLRDTELLINSGVDGVFLENPGQKATTLLGTYREVNSRFPDSFIGLSFEGLRKLRDTLICLNLAGVLPNAIWHRYYLPDQDQLPAKEQLEWLYPALDDILDRVEMFIGIANPTDPMTVRNDPRLCSEHANKVKYYADYITMDGVPVGSDTLPPDIIRLKAIRSVSPPKIAIAGGVNVDNIRDYVGLVEAVLVKQADLETTQGEIDPARLSQFMSNYRVCVAEEQKRREALTPTT